ncbi:hypothetical protein K439DRAFT_1359273, partial [Ramaria rubella]
TYDGKIHLVMDGWTAPLHFSYLGIVIVWYAQGRINHTILEFVRLTEKHMGKYLAQVTADCLKRFGVSKLVLRNYLDMRINSQ